MISDVMMMDLHSSIAHMISAVMMMDGNSSNANMISDVMMMDGNSSNALINVIGELEDLHRFINR